MMKNILAMPLAEWLMRMSLANVEPAARMLALYASVLDVTGNDELARLSGVSGRTFDKHKASLVKAGWVLISRREGGRGCGIEVTPAVNETPVKFTDVSGGNPREICARLAQQTPAEVAGFSHGKPPQKLPPFEPQTPAEITGVSPSRAPACAHFEIPSGLVISNSYPTTTVELEPARGGRGEDHEFLGLNGTAVDLIAFIGKHAFVDEFSARRMLKTNIQAFGIDAMLEAYSVTLAEMGGKGVAAPYKFLMGCARNAKARGAQPKGLKGTARTMEIARKLAAQGGVT